MNSGATVVEAFNNRKLIENALCWMRARGWHRLLAKRANFEQSLLEHSLLELDVLLEILPTLCKSNHYDLTLEEQQLLCVAVLVHDTGKESPEWQACVRGKGPKVGHIDLARTLEAIPDLCKALGLPIWTDSVQELIALCAEFHHNRAGRSDGDIFTAIFNGETNRFQTLAHIVRGVDHFCSASSAADAVRVIERDAALGNHLCASLHQIRIRGVSSIYLHSAARDAFRDKGWTPILYFKDGTVYVCPAECLANKVSAEEIEANLLQTLERMLSKDVVSLMIGSPQGNILPKPDLVKFDEVKSYLSHAASRIGAQSFSKKGIEKRRDVVTKYWALSGREGGPTSEQIDVESMNISVAQAEMLVFKVFKALINLECVPKDAADSATTMYEETFGIGSWKRLQSTSTLMPAKDMAGLIDPFWNLAASVLGCPELDSVRQISPQLRTERLVLRLSEILETVCGTHSIASPRVDLARKMSKAFSTDLVVPCINSDWREVALHQKENYSVSKSSAGKLSGKAFYLCPICNSSFSSKLGIKAGADFIEKPESHTNRASSLTSFDAIIICNVCYFERLLLQMACGLKPQELIFVIPQLNLGPRHGELLVERVRKWVAAAQLQISGDGDSSSAFYLNLIQTPAKQLLSQDPLGLSDEQLLELFMNKLSPDRHKDRVRKITAAVKEEFDDDLEEACARAGSDFSSWDALANAVIERTVNVQEFVLIRQSIFRASGSMHLACETPNLVMIPLAREISGSSDESDTSKALRKIFIALTLGLAFSARIAIKKDGEHIDSASSGGCAFVPPLPAVRALIPCEWIAIPDALTWLRAIGSASMLSRSTKFPERNALFQVLSAEPAEWIARRIETVSDTGNVTLKQLELIECLPYFRGTKQTEEKQ